MPLLERDNLINVLPHAECLGNALYEYLPPLSRRTGVPQAAQRLELTSVELNPSSAKDFEAHMVNPESYRGNLLNLLGNQNPLDVLSKTASALAGIIREHPASVLRARPFASKWTPNEIIGHLVDGEWVYGYRLRLIVCEDCPTVLGTQQDAWVARQRHNEREPSELVDIFRTLREFNLAVWRRTTAAELERTGSHNERGPESLAVMLRMMAGHDLSHLAQIERYLGTLVPLRPTPL